MLANHLMCSSKKGVSAKQIERTVGVSYNSAWFMMHRLREAMKPADALPPLGGKGKVVEVDETFIGKKPGEKKRRGYKHKHAVLTLVERGGKSRSFHVDGTKAQDILPILRANIASKTQVMTDDAGQYNRLWETFPGHQSVAHSAGEYVRGNVHINTAENFYSVFKRGMKGVYQHCGENHLHRYVTEFDFRYSNRSALGVDDTQRADTLLRGIEGKRLTYRRIDAEATQIALNHDRSMPDNRQRPKRKITSSESSYWQALGQFIEQFSVAETFLFHLHGEYAKVSLNTARAVFSGMRTEQLIKNIIRIWERETPDADTKNELDDVFKQFRAINTVRNIMIHNVSRPANEMVRTVDDFARALRQKREHKLHISLEIMAAMTADLEKIAMHFVSHLLFPEVPQPITLAIRAMIVPVLNDAWQYKRPADHQGKDGQDRT
jgi:hypothetical protein